jgi:hypothetical protein
VFGSIAIHREHIGSANDPPFPDCSKRLCSLNPISTANQIMEPTLETLANFNVFQYAHSLSPLPREAHD